MQDYKPSIDVQAANTEGADYMVLVFSGELDKAGLEVVKDDLNRIVEELEQKYLIFDFSKLNFVNSEGIGFIMTIHYRLTKKEKELVIVGAEDHVLDVLKVIGLLNVMKYYKTMDEFKASLNA